MRPGFFMFQNSRGGSPFGGGLVESLKSNIGDVFCQVFDGRMIQYAELPSFFLDQALVNKMLQNPMQVAVGAA